jgi:two-component system phosphate regulon sensor histidine kinase PhoR
LKSSTIRLIVVFAALVAIGIITTQIYWVRKAYDVEKRTFDYKVNVSLRNVAEQLLRLNNNPMPVFNVVEQVSPGLYTVMVNDQINERNLEILLTRELEQYNVLTDFEYAYYDCMKNHLQYGKYVDLPGNNEKARKPYEFPPIKKTNYYFAVYFPHMQSYLSTQMNFWIISSLVLLVVISYLAYVIFVILKQKRLSEVQKDFVNNMTHEFKTPLSTIQLAAEVLTKPEIVDKPQRLMNYATLIINESKLLTSQVERVLQMSATDKGYITLRKQLVDVHEILEQCTESFRPTVESKGGSITLQLQAQHYTLNADPLHLKNAINNLLDNAIKYCDCAPEILIETQDNRQYLTIRITDNGIGIDKKYQKDIFNKFFRVPTGNIHDVKGFGLGLNYVKLICRSHEGDVDISSGAGKGSVFTIILPI